MQIREDRKSGNSFLASTESYMHSSLIAIEDKYVIEKRHKLGKYLKCFAKLILVCDMLFGAMFVWIYMASIVCKIIGKRYKMINFWF